MSATTKIKWMRALARLRFSYEELDLMKEAAHSVAQEFQEYYETFCRDRNIDITHLNNKHRDRVNKLYNIEKAIPDNQHKWEPKIDPIDDTTIALHNDYSSYDDTEEHQMTADEIAVHDSFSKLFKQIALKIHPDKLSDDMPEKQKELNISMFQKANKAFNDKKYFTLLDIASELDIRTPKNYEQQTRWMKKESAIVEQEISKQKNTYNFLFSEAETDEERDQLIRGFLLQVFHLHVD